jgi:hypothetical protein
LAEYGLPSEFPIEVKRLHKNRYSITAEEIANRRDKDTLTLPLIKRC